MNTDDNTNLENENITKVFAEGRIIGGIILVGIGVVLLLRQMGFMFPNWLFNWPVILILLGIYSGFKHNFRNRFWMIAVAVGGIYLVNDILPGLKLEPYIWPALIIFIGLLFILRPQNYYGFKNSLKDNFMHLNPSLNTAETLCGTSLEDHTDYLKINSVFSGVNRKVLSKDFKGAKISSVFGGTEIDFTQADLTGSAIIKMEIVFGGVKLFVPAHWAVVNEIDGVFHGVDDKRRFNVAPEINPTKVLVLKGSVVFGGIEIRTA